ncbi:MAG: YhbY family RNA-binding protein [Candidatus Nezhaarchaeota archaeon]|nr:YhbY family RNA-binding protein [Candidatus Nezhaarchaeota archaeon]
MKESIKKRLKEKMMERADVNVGKHGLANSVLKEIDRRLNDKEVVKVRILRSALVAEGIEDRKKLAENLAKKLNVDAMEIRGYTVVLYRKRRKRTL